MQNRPPEQQHNNGGIHSDLGPPLIRMFLFSIHARALGKTLPPARFSPQFRLPLTKTVDPNQITTLMLFLTAIMVSRLGTPGSGNFNRSYQTMPLWIPLFRARARVLTLPFAPSVCFSIVRSFEKEKKKLCFLH